MLGFGNFLNILRSRLTRAESYGGQRRRGISNKPATITGLPPVKWDRDKTSEALSLSLIDSAPLAFSCLEWIDFVSCPSTMAVRKVNIGRLASPSAEESFYSCQKGPSRLYSEKETTSSHSSA
jgi:hypothetical protein